MCVAVVRHEADRRTVGLNGLGKTQQLIEHIAEVEEGQRVIRIGCGGATIESLRLSELPPVVLDRTQIDAGGRVALVQRKNGFIVGHGLLRLAPLFHLHGFKEEGLYARFPRGLMARGRTHFRQLTLTRGIKVEYELARDRLHHGATEAKSETRSVTN